MLKANPPMTLNGQSVAAFGAASSDHLLTRCSGHSFQESTSSFGFADCASKCSFHYN